jgi:ribosome-associated heat shock protein Hsp15
MRARTDCAGLVAQGSIRINRQPTGKPHAKLRVGDVLTIPLHGSVRVLQVASLAIRRGPASEARLLYTDLSPPDPGPAGDTSRDISDVSATSCIAADSSAYRAQ